MSTDTNLLGKGLIRLGILIFLFIATPITLTMGFKAFDRYTEAPKVYLAYTQAKVNLWLKPLVVVSA